MLSAVFVYGTLKRGQCRERLWPCRPRRVVPAWTAGRLYGRSDYPAMTPGDDRVAGERWEFDDEQMGRVLKTLDAIEGFVPEQSDNLYTRVTADVFDSDGNELGSAWTYHYARAAEPDGFTLICPGVDDLVRWPPPEP